ncbi:hypothetical protein LXA26_18305, partial [Erwinia amylovora]|uniref:hypothetical protein n=1 Tax=Erwinia amylovora TaxID=552 RepID=UPI0020C149C4
PLQLSLVRIRRGILSGRIHINELAAYHSKRRSVRDECLFCKRAYLETIRLTGTLRDYHRLPGCQHR